MFGFINNVKNLDILVKLQTGQALSASDVERVGSAISQAEKEGKFKKGYQFVQGFLVKVTLPPN
jgi:hypothetical protein